MKKKLFSAFCLAALFCLSAAAQDLKINGIGHNNRYDDGEQMTSTYLGWNSELQKAIFIVDNGLYTMSWNGSALSTPVKEPPVVATEIKGNNDKEIWANNFNMMYANSGALYVDGKLITVTSRDEQSTTDDVLFAVRKWNAKTGDLLSTELRPKSDCLESAGMAYNPLDGKIYGLFYLTEQKLSEEFTGDPDFFVDEDGESSDQDAGYAICTLDPKTMKITPVTPGLYYYNFVTFAINSEGRAFALTSGGSNAVPGDDGKVRDINLKLAGAQLCEFDLTTGLMKTKTVEGIDSETGDPYTEEVNIYDQGTGYCSQYSRQSACFDKNNPNKMYWNGYFNSGKGLNEWGSWSSLPDKEWRTNGKFDTCLYEVDITTGEATRLSNIANRWIFSAMWVDGADSSDGAGIEVTGSNEPTDGIYLALQHADNGCIWQQVEMGRQYTFLLQPADGWMLHSVTFNGTELEVTDGNSVTTPAVSAALSHLIVTFEENSVNAIRGIQDEAPSQIKVLGKRGGITVKNADGEQLTVYNANGSLVLTQKVDGQQVNVNLAPGQLYLVKVGAKVLKIRL